ncbi:MULTISPECIES: FeoA family protein [Fischerella]|uniref:Ferrous iron transport protein A n=1 Tax=Fischerella muscicola CCMEE 5323 TaxID=2019572 RepID=A0A2N6K4Q2_FISMU|nr:MULTISPECIES: FeoA family protein [Fischerella]MBD2433654.1 ferrous iron transport protein A [Fischerella sp. FACHB-380]PLZ91197.1 ferrous iron transport protein A [Fischerella muscicola CCMEE 5323]
MFNGFSVTGSSLELLKIGEKGIIQFCNTQDVNLLNQVISLGLTPGTYLTVEKQFPNFVINVRQRRLAISKEIARKIYVRIVNR